MRRFQMAAIGAVVCSLLATDATGQSRDVRADRQRGIHWILNRMEAGSVANLRSSCAAGDPVFGSAMLLNATRASFSLSVAELCVTVLTRAGRDRTLRYMTVTSGQTTPAITFDTGFVNGYLKGEQLPAGAPTIATLLPAADRCLNHKEQSARLCSSAGYVLGARAARGELVPLP